MKFQHNQICIFLLIFILQKEIKCQVLVDLKNGICACEEMLNEFECKILSKCKYEGGKCKSLPCEDLNADGCWQASRQGCIFDKVEEKCSKFKDCSSYESKSQYDCSLLPAKCSYNSVLKKCEDQTQLPSCSEQLESECFHGKEGICVFKDGKCQEFTECEDVGSNDKRCTEASPLCTYGGTSDKCKHIFGGCEYSKSPTCPPNRETINGENSFLCEQSEIYQGKCNYWETDEQTIETCIVKSSLTHHWKDNECQKCQPDKPISSLQLEIVIMLLALTY